MRDGIANYWDGRCFVINSEFGQVVGRTPEQAQKTLNRLMSGKVEFDRDGIGRKKASAHE